MDDKLVVTDFHEEYATYMPHGHQLMSRISFLTNIDSVLGHNSTRHSSTCWCTIHVPTPNSIQAMKSCSLSSHSVQTTDRRLHWRLQSHLPFYIYTAPLHDYSTYNVECPYLSIIRQKKHVGKSDDSDQLHS